MDTITTQPVGRIRRLRLRPRQPERLASVIVLALVLAALVYGFLHRNDSWLDPEDGVGYWLGIAGASMMLILLIYPLRKRNPKLRPLGSVGFWFRFHMLLGLLGPVTILYHSRFGWGSLNSGMALMAMIIVASSGLIGRFLYSRVHRGYSTRTIAIRDLKRDMDELLDDLEHEHIGDAYVIDTLHDLEDRALASGRSFWSGARSFVSLRLRSLIIRREIRRQLQDPDAKHREELLLGLEDFFRATRRASSFAFYSRLLRLWHYLHLPLFVLLVAAVTLHIVAVHQY
ncbi:hypothetical protein K3148_08830 [Qipengyuania aurantiaca]|uniref:Pyridine nucleotide-disulfide oxidoreductase n=1 Tax=Qipengyuania aurantiaca TaxID=2867233 RepID=A0ABX8ZJ26_9SPHN|nr:hypothetical protein [Qipengyuania aurantiaca]QZD88952.1 hypothetical protein K3148_08830 [Qipengyuania aurantiaca]